MRDTEELAVKLFSESKITVSEAAEIAHLSLGEMMELLSARGIVSNITLVSCQVSISNK